MLNNQHPLFNHKHKAYKDMKNAELQVIVSNLRYDLSVECHECHGEGTYESGPSCYKPASECCGGCYETHHCEICDGNGILEFHASDDEVYDQVLSVKSIEYRLESFNQLRQASIIEAERLGCKLELIQHPAYTELVKDIRALEKLRDSILEDLAYIVRTNKNI